MLLFESYGIIESTLDVFNSFSRFIVFNLANAWIDMCCRKKYYNKKKRICQTLLKVSQKGYIIKTILKSFNSYTKNKQHSEMRLYNALTFKC